MNKKIKEFMKADISKLYILGVALICLLLLGSYFSFAMFTVTKEKNNAIRIVTGNLTYTLQVDSTNSNTLSVPANTTKTFTVTLSNPNSRVARFNFYYVGSLPSNVEVGYITTSGMNTPPSAAGINLEAAGSSGSINSYKIKVSNNTSSSKTITLGVQVGLDYNDLSLPSNGHLFEEAPLEGPAADVLLEKVNNEDLDYNSATDSQKKEMWTFTHPATDQTEALTDYRYIGADPNNYVTFNNEMWRIIGVFTVDDGTGNMEQRVKIIRNEAIGNKAWNSNNTNNWPNATLNTDLNTGDYWTNDLGSDAKNMIDNAVWYLGGASNFTSASNGLASHFYSYERGTTVYSGRSTSWTGKVGLLYPSDYGYATSGGTTTDRNACLNKELYSWDSSSVSDCKNNDWLFNSNSQWTITPRANISNVVLYLNSVGYLYFNPATTDDFEIRPVVFLKSDVKIVDGDGSSSNPYKLQAPPSPATEIVLAKANPEDLDYNSATDTQKKEMWTFSHSATDQTEALTDYRYIGASPNNYINFNNELWRIIGVFTVDDGTGKKEERLKIISTVPFYNRPWDSPNTNDWPNSSIKNFINDDSNFSNEAHDMLEDALWYLGGTSSYTSSNASHFYSYERGTTVYSGRSTSWVGKVGLMYLSDYGYATSGGTTTTRTSCLNSALFRWTSDCINNDWLYQNYYQWTMTPYSSNSTSVFFVDSSGTIYYCNASIYFNYMTFPVAFLKSDVKIADGDGSESNPYILNN